MLTTDTDELEFRLLEFLRSTTGEVGMKYKSRPEKLKTGFSSAELFQFELSNSQTCSNGPFILRLTNNQLAPLQPMEVTLQTVASSEGLPVPEIYFYENDARTLGRPFFIMKKVPGNSVYLWICSYIAVSLLFALATGAIWSLLVVLLICTIHMAGILLGFLKRLYGLKPEGLEILSASDQTKGTMGTWLERISLELSPSGMERYKSGERWLRENMWVPNRPVVCHGDFHPQNILIHRGVVSGVVDWETACLCDSEFEFAFIKTYASIFPPLLMLSQSLVVFQWLQGKYNAKAARYYEACHILYSLVWANAQMVRSADLAGCQSDGKTQFLVKDSLFHKWYCYSLEKRFKQITGISCCE